MTTTLAFRFPWGKLHATPWGRHVNEAAVEWPLSPWRILRAFYATWKTRADHLDEAVVTSLFGELAIAPSFALPERVEATTRHYMPDSAYGTGKVIDAFAVMERNAVMYVRWPSELSLSQREALRELCEQLSYLGRAESVCTASIVETNEMIEVDWVPPMDDEIGIGERVLAPELPLDLNSLVLKPGGVRKLEQVLPPSTRWVRYEVPGPAETLPAQADIATKRPTAVRWAIARNARPSQSAAVVMSDVLRSAAMSRFGRLTENGVSPTMAGKDSQGVPLLDHRHAHYLAIDEDKDGLLDHLIAWSPCGFDDTEITALTEVRRLTGYGHIREFRPSRLGVEAIGDIEDVAQMIVGPSQVWESHTPFSPTRHPKRQSWDDHIAEEINRELGYRGLPGAEVEVQRGPWLLFRRHRVNEKLSDARRVAGLRLKFDRVVSGPIALGGLSHFGLGLFIPSGND